MSTRRQFLLTTAGLGGALVSGVSIASAGPRRAVSAPALTPQERDVGNAVTLNAWLRISPDGTVWLAMPRSEMGQGVHMGLRMLVAEELGCSLESLRLEDPDVRPEFANGTVLAESVPFRPDDEGFVARSARSVMRKAARVLDMQVTGGSTSLMDAWDGLRAAAASTRQRLELAAAATWGVDAAGVNLADGMVTVPDGRRMTLAEALPGALQQATPHTIRFRDPARYTIIGHNPPRTDLRGKVDGSAVFGVDVRVPGRVVAVPRLCPALGGTVKAVHNRDALKARPGIIDVIDLPLLTVSGGILVIADGFWPALKAAEAADIEWSTPARSELLNSDRILAKLRQDLDGTRTHWTYLSRGDASWSSSADTPAQVKADYSVPFLAHATLEPMNATAWLRDGALDVWAPTQGQGPARARAAQVAGLSASAVRIHTTYLGGGFGRRVESDFVAMAAFAAAALPGRPVQVMWTREDDTTHDYYRPAAAARLQARLGPGGRITHWHHRCASPSVSHQAYQRVGLPGMGPDKAAAEGAFDQAYQADHLRVDHVLRDAGVPVGYWRSVGHSYQAFFAESFIDELAHHAGIDPLAFRLKNLPPDSRQARVLKAVCEMAGYGTTRPAGSGQNANKPAGHAGSALSAGDTALGMAVHLSFGSAVAQVVEVQRTAAGVRVTRVWCAVDCGLPVHPDGIRQQMEGGVIFALTAALKGRIDIDSGMVRQRNFNDYPLLSLTETPEIRVSVLPSAQPPSGVGEVAVPPLAPALANALFRLTGQRQRELPLRL